MAFAVAPEAWGLERRKETLSCNQGGAGCSEAMPHQGELPGTWIVRAEAIRIDGEGQGGELRSGARLQRNENCIKAQNAVMMRCFRGGNRSHLDERDNVVRDLNNCKKWYAHARAQHVCR